MKNYNIINEAADSIEAHLKHSSSHSITHGEIAAMLPGLTPNEINNVIRLLLSKRVMKHSVGRFTLNYERREQQRSMIHQYLNDIERREQQRSMIHQYLNDIERAASVCMSLPPVNWLDIFGGDLDQNERTIFQKLAEPMIKMWEASYYERERLGHFRNLQKGTSLSCN